MENARPIKDEASAPGTGAAIVHPGTLPARQDTVTADVLARLLTGERLTGLDAVVDSSTTRLSAVVHRLESAYCWEIAREDRAAGCKDGRVAWVRVYFMARQVIALAAQAGAVAWCADVRRARAALRTEAAAARRAADRFNASRKTRPSLGQAGLFDDGAAA
jgi:hypothetical protein